jgi:hypothetical protein
MSDQVKPEAFFDSLSLAHKLDNFLDGFRLEEIHLFAYFSSILFLYKGNPVADWSYKFTVTAEGYPFSNELYEAINRHLQNGLFDTKGTFYTLTGRGTDEFNKFKGLQSFSKREECLNAACTTSILVPYSQTLRALLRDDELTKIKELKSGWLDQQAVYPKFEEISKAIGVPAQDLIIPAVTWINYINEQESININNNA